MTVYLTTLLFSDLAWRPQPALILQIILLTTVQALVMITGAVVVSSQTTSTRAANLLASFIIIPMTLLINGESIVIFIAPDANSVYGIGALWAIIVGMLVVAILLLRVGNSIFNREELLGRSIDQLNIKTFSKKVWAHIRAVDDEGTPARNLVDWYRRSVGLSLRRLQAPMKVAVLVFVMAFLFGVVIGSMERWRLPLPTQDEFAQEEDSSIDAFRGILNTSVQGEAMMFIFVQNTRILLAAFILSIFTFGIASLVMTPLTYAILGYLMMQFLFAGYDISLVIGAVATHGIIEIPMIVIAAAIGLRIGAVVTRPHAVAMWDMRGQLHLLIP